MFCWRQASSLGKRVVVQEFPCGLARQYPSCKGTKGQGWYTQGERHVGELKTLLACILSTNCKSTWNQQITLACKVALWHNLQDSPCSPRCGVRNMIAAYSVHHWHPAACDKAASTQHVICAVSIAVSMSHPILLDCALTVLLHCRLQDRAA